MKRPPKPAELVLLSLALVSLPVSLDAQGTSSAAAAEETDEDVIVLSAFEVRENDNVNYVANSTLARTRINTKLRDVGASISVFTPEFMADTGATGAGQLLTLSVGSEVGGSGGNFAGGGLSGGRADQSDSRENPQGNQRIRGIGPAALSRDYFLTDIAFDTYNVSAVTINRGPNSLLFGIGNPAGVIEASTIKALLHKHSYSTSARYGSNDSYRGTFDINRVLVKDRVAVRLAGMYDENVYDQKPAFDRDKRIFGTVRAVLANNERSNVLGQLVVNASAETGVRNSTPVNVIPPTDAFSIWFSPLDPAIDNLPGVTMEPKVTRGNAAYIWRPKVTIDNRTANANLPELSNSWVSAPYFIQIPLIYDTPGQLIPGYQNTNNPALTPLAGVMGRIRYVPATNGRGPIDAASTKTAYNNLAGFSTPTLQNREIFDYRNNLISGGSNTIEQGFDTFNVALTQDLLEGNAGVELAYDTQVLHSRRQLPFSFGTLGAQNGVSDINIDVAQYISNDQPNPNLERPFIVNIGSQERYTRTDRDSVHATAFYRLDLEKEDRRLFGLPLGTHTFTRLYSTQKIDTRSENYDLY
ncbi:MAG TPA: TonB-dependent receptor plug domain-containing protein [Opitutaceae bacterium]